MKQKIMYLVSILVGIIFWLVLTKVTGKSEAWDDSFYFRMGIPILATINLVLGVFEPIKPWRWGLTSTLSQAIPMVVMNPSGNLLPLGLIAFVILSVPSVIASCVGSFLRKYFYRPGIDDRK
ncbi:MAG: hypothetical protein Q7S24_00495 [bacterium]|nr:hypothetical protein [bacterium]